MILQVREFAKTWVAKILLVLVILSFVVVGAQSDLFGAIGSNNVVEAGSRSQSAGEFKMAFDRWKEEIEQQNGGQPIPMDDLVARGGVQSFLEQQEVTRGFAEWAHRAGIRPSHTLITEAVRDNPALFNQVTGKFDSEIYRAKLAEVKLDEKTFETSMHDGFVRNHYGQAILSGVRAPRIMSVMAAVSGLQTRDASWFNITQAMAGAAGVPTEAQLESLLKQIADDVRRPEYRTMSIALFNPKADAIPAPTDKQIQDRYDVAKASLSQPETRSYILMTAADQAAAGRIVTALRGGQSPSQAASAGNTQPTPVQAQARTAIGDAGLAAAVFSTDAGKVSEPVRTGQGWSVVAVTEVIPAQSGSLESVRPAIVAQLQQEARRAETYKMVERFQGERDRGASMEDAARASGATIQKVGPVAADGTNPKKEPQPIPPQVLATAFALGKGETSDTVDLGQTQYFAIRVDEITPPALPTVDDLRPALVRGWTQTENGRKLDAKADELTARLRNGESIETVAASVGARLVRQNDLGINQQTAESLGQTLLRTLFSQPRVGSVFSAPTSDNAGRHIGKIEAIRAPATARVNETVRVIEAQGQGSSALQQDIGDSLLQLAASAVGAHGDLARARAALGLAAEVPVTEAPAAAPAKK